MLFYFQALNPVNARANVLGQDSASSTSLGKISETLDAVTISNTSYVYPAGVKCESFTGDIQALEELVNNATRDSATASERTAASALQIQQLTEEIGNIGGIDTAELDALRTRIQVGQGLFAEGQYNSVIAALRVAVDEQETWLAELQRDAKSIRSQINVLDSFRVNV